MVSDTSVQGRAGRYARYSRAELEDLLDKFRESTRRAVRVAKELGKIAQNERGAYLAVSRMVQEMCMASDPVNVERAELGLPPIERAYDEG